MTEALPNFVVSNLPDVPAHYGRFQPQNVISLTRNNVPAHPTIQNHLRLAFDDLTHDSPGALIAGYEGPMPQHIDAIISFAKALDKNSKTLIHCDAGISRSTAALWIVVTAQYGIDWVLKNWKRVYMVRPVMWPNKLMIKYADDALVCEDRLNRICHAIILNQHDWIPQIEARAQAIKDMLPDEQNAA